MVAPNAASREAEATIQALTEELARRNEELRSCRAEMAVAFEQAQASEEAFRSAARRFEGLFQGLPVACYTTDAAGLVQEWNEAATDLWGIPAHAAFQRPVVGTAVGEPHRELAESVARRVFAGETVTGLERSETLDDGSVRRLMTSVFPLRGPNETVVGAVSANLDVTARWEAEGRLRLLSLVAEKCLNGVLITDADERILFANRAFEAYTGYALSELEGRKPKEMLQGEDTDPAARAILRRAVERGEPASVEIVNYSKSGRRYWVEVNLTPVHDDQGRVTNFLAIENDVTERKASLAHLAEKEERFRTTVDSLHEGIVLQDAEGRIVLWNPSAERVLGLSGDQLAGRTSMDPRWRTIREDGSDLPGEAHPAMVALRTGEAQEATVMGVRRPDGALRWLSVNATPILPLGGGAPLAAVASFIDITEIRAQARSIEDQMVQLSAYSAALEIQKLDLEDANARLEAMATTDGLTGLKNHRCFQDSLQGEIDRLRRAGGDLSLVLLDVDRFKAFNDDFGHQTGDAVLREVAAILQATARTSDLVARYGGEEFVLVLPDTDAPGACQVAERLRIAVATARWTQRPVTASFGVSTFRGGMAKDDLIREADEALYESKRQGRNAVTHRTAAL